MSPSTESTSKDGIGARDGLRSSPKHRLDALPAELLKLIVLLVKEQDERLEIVAHAIFSPGGSTRMRGSALKALSSTSRRLREAALPFMCEVVRSRHLTHPLFQLGALPPALLRGVRKVNCLGIKRETLASIVAGLNMLPNLEAIDIGHYTTLSLTRTQSSAAVAGSSSENELAHVPSEVIKNVFRRCRSRWRTVTYSSGSEGGLEQALELFCDPAQLERLELSELVLRRSAQPTRLEHLLRYHHLTSLSIGISNDGLLNTADVPSFVRLPALRSFEIGGWAQAILPLAEQIAPNVVDLRIIFSPSRLETQPAAFHLPHLRHLTVEMLWTAADLLHTFAKCDIVSLRWIEMEDDEGVYVDKAETPTALAVPAVDKLPASLRAIIFEPDDGRLYEGVDNGWSDDDIAVLAAKCASRGIAFKVKPGSRVRTGYRAFTEMPAEWPANASEVCGQKGASLRDLLEWATRRVGWLEQTGDVAGMRDMVEKLTKLKQRQAIEEA